MWKLIGAVYIYITMDWIGPLQGLFVIHFESAGWSLVHEMQQMVPNDVLIQMRIALQQLCEEDRCPKDLTI